MKRLYVNPVDVPGSITTKQQKALTERRLPCDPNMTSRQAARAIATYQRELKKVERPRKTRSRRKRKDIKEFAKKLNKNLPKSEQWFQKLYAPYMIDGDLFNHPFGSHIPDLVNKQHKYIVEVDGSWHDKAYVQLQDRKKDRLRASMGYLCLRIKAYDQEQFDAAMAKINARRYEGYGLPVTKLTEKEYRERLKEEARSDKREGESE